MAASGIRGGGAGQKSRRKRSRPRPYLNFYACKIDRFQLWDDRGNRTPRKKALGTFQPCRSLEVQAKTNTELSSQPPKCLTKEAREAWRIAVENAPKGLLAVTDFTVLERWARNYALYRKLAKAVDHDGTTIVTEKADGTVRRELNPDAKLLVQIQTVLLACERELGFTPSSRARVNVATKDEPVNEFDGF